jgi:STE24 endopeptidase
MTWAFPTWIAPLFNKFKPLDQGELRKRLTDLLQRCGFEDNGMFVMDGSRRSSHGNAYFTGFGKNKRIVFYDTLLTQLTPPETEAVLAHELGHFKRRHILKRLASMAILTLIGFALLGWLKQQEWFYLGLGVHQADNALALLLFVLVTPVFIFLLQPVASWFSRKHEFEADDFASQQSSGAELISALVKLYRDNANTLTPDPVYSAYHHSHPPAPVRIANISSKLRQR